MKTPAFDGILDITGLPYVDQGGYRRSLACLPDRRVRSRLPAAAHVIPEVHESRWIEVDNRHFDADVGVEDQLQFNSCTANALAGGSAIAWRKTGLSPVRFGPGWTYAHINKGVDQGATLEDCLESARRDGLCPSRIVDQSPFYLNQMPPGAAEEAANYVPDLVVALEGYDQAMSVVQLEGVVFFAICVGQDFDRLDTKGRAPTYPKFQPNHAVFADGSRLVDGRMYLDVKNSWGARYGDGGRCLIGREGYGKYFCGAYGIFTMRQDPRQTRIPLATVARAVRDRAVTGFSLGLA